MLLLSDIKGQDSAVRYLSNCLSSERIANGYLFFGPRGVGRSSCAKAFFAELACPHAAGGKGACSRCPVCSRVDALEHPDLIWIKPEKNKAIKIEEIRRIRDILNLKPYESSFSVCVIEDAHMMTPEAANALLKVLEEPPGTSFLILTTDKRETLPATVVSRCAEVRFKSLPGTVTRDIIMRERPDIGEEKARFLAFFSQGSPGRALEMIEEGVIGRKDDLIAMIDKVAGEENAFCLNWDSEDKGRLLEDLEMMVMFLRDVAMEKEGLKDMVLDKDIPGTEMYAFFEKRTVDEIYAVTERIIKIKVALAGNVNPKIVAQILPGMLK